MAKHSKIGLMGEQIAENFLLKKGYKILHKNWRSGHKELDMVALLNDTLIIVETKTRTTYDFGFPEEAVNRKKQKLLKIAAEAFVFANPQYLNIRFDIISILLNGEEVKEILHFEEAFY